MTATAEECLGYGRDTLISHGNAEGFPAGTLTTPPADIRAAQRKRKDT